MRVRQFIRDLAFILFVATLVPLTQAQEFRGKIQGLVTDSSQGVIPGATVTLLNVKTGAQTVRESNNAGFYIIDRVDPGAYTLTVEAQGFSKFVQENITVQMQADITVNATLKIGAINETVTVTESPVAVAFNSTSIGMTLDDQLTTELPTTHRNPFKLAYLNPAVRETWSDNKTVPWESPAANNLDLGGNTSKRNELKVDGSTVAVGDRASYVPNADSVQEVNIQQNAVDAEIGHSAGGSVAMTLKSGSNAWHGTASFMYRNPSWNATADRTTRTAAGNMSKIGAATLGNPIIKNKLFNFFSFEQWWQRTPSSFFMTLPTDLERQGDFSKSLTNKGALKVIYDPYSTVVSSAGVTRTPFPDNKIPANRINPLTSSVLKSLWAPNRTPDDPSGTNNFSTTTVQVNDYWNLSDRVDWLVNDKLRINGRYSRFNADIESAHSDLLYANEFYVPNTSPRLSRSYSAEAIWTATKTTVASFHFTYHRLEDTAGGKDLGPDGLAKYWPNDAWYKPYQTEDTPDWFPRMNFGSNANSIGANLPIRVQQPGGWSWDAKLSQQRGSHFLKTGFEMRQSFCDICVAFTKHVFNFTPALTANTYLSPNTTLVGHTYATALLGVLDDVSNQAFQTNRHTRTGSYAAYIQDDWKVNRRITLNLGLRWEVESPWHDDQNMGTIGVDLTSPIPEFQSTPPVLPASVTALRTAPPVWNGAWTFTSEDHPGMWKMENWVFMPRMGMALRINDKTALRVGWARFVAPGESVAPGGWGAFVVGSYPGFDVSQTALPLNQGVPQTNVSNPFPTASNPLLPPYGKAYGRYTNLGGTASWMNSNFRRTVNDRINVTFSKELPGRLVTEFTYFTNFGRYLSDVSQSLNNYDPRIGYSNKAQMDVQVLNPFYNYLTPDKFPGPLRNQRTVATKTLLSAYPQYGALTVTLPSNQDERYHSLQIKVQRPFQNGINFMFGYSYRREKQKAYYDELATYLNDLSWQQSVNPRHGLTAAGMYELPFGKGRYFGNTWPKSLDYILGGWQMNGLLFYRSGNFLKYGPMISTGDPHLEDPTPQKWFDTSKFSILPAYTQRTNPWIYPDVKGPYDWGIDATIGKSIRMGEKFRTEMRLAAFNLTNRFHRADPDVTITNATFGTALRQATLTSGRQLEIQLKIVF